MKLLSTVSGGVLGCWSPPFLAGPHLRGWGWGQESWFCPAGRLLGEALASRRGKRDPLPLASQSLLLLMVALWPTDPPTPVPPVSVIVTGRTLLPTPTQRANGDTAVATHLERVPGDGRRGQLSGSWRTG